MPAAELNRRQLRTLLALAAKSSDWLTRLAATEARCLIVQGFPALARRKLVVALSEEK